MGTAIMTHCDTTPVLELSKVAVHTNACREVSVFFRSVEEVQAGTAIVGRASRKWTLICPSVRSMAGSCFCTEQGCVFLIMRKLGAPPVPSKLRESFRIRHPLQRMNRLWGA